jgi:spore maturation protein CgeB
VNILFVASLHHPQHGHRTGESHPATFPVSQAQHFWVKSLTKMGHACAVFWRSTGVLTERHGRPLRMTRRMSLRRAALALTTWIPELNLDFRLRNRRLLEFARNFQPDMILMIGGNQVILPETLRALKRRHHATLIYTCGTPPSIFSHRVERASAGLYDLVIANDLYHAQEWRGLGASHAEVLPMSAVDPDFHHRRSDDADLQKGHRTEVGFVGTLLPQKLYAQRIAALEALRDFDLGIWSVHETSPSLQAAFRGPALGESMMRVLSGAAIVVNPHGDFMRYGGNMRLFEACGAGALQITNECPAVERWFQPGAHLITYRQVAELPHLVAHYLAHEDERRRIAAAGQAHVYAHHTYDQRMARLIKLIAEIER